jgi:hypothetical protein
MHTIHKVQLTGDFLWQRGHQDLHLSGFMKALCVQVQKGIPCFWYEASETEASYTDDHPKLLPLPIYRIYMVQTGQALPTKKEGWELSYISTIQDPTGSFVYHFYLESKV